MEDISGLISCCVKGDRGAMELLYKTYSLRMMRVIRRYISDPRASEDILHDGFIVIFTRIGDVRECDRLEYWMASIMKNLCLSYLSQLDLTTLLNEDIAVPDLPELDDLLGYDELMALINRLPDGYRNVFKLAVLDGKSHREIGRILGIEPHTSSSQLYHARQLLRKMIVERKKELGMLGLLLPLLIAGWLFIGRDSGSPSVPGPSSAIKVTEAGSSTTVEMIQDEIIAETHPVHMPTSRSQRASSLNTPETEAVPVTVDSIPVATDEMKEMLLPDPEKIAEEIVAEGDTTLLEPLVIPAAEYDLAEYKIPVSAAENGWSISPALSLDPSLISLRPGGDQNYESSSPPLGDAQQPGNPGAPHFPVKPFAPNPVRVYDTEARHDMPLTLGVNVSRRLSNLVSVETGFNTTMLRTTLHYTSYKVDASRKVRTFYVGVPLKVNLRYYHDKSLSLYATAGGEVAFPVGMSSSLRNNDGSSGVPVLPELTVRPQFSLLGGAGLQYNFSHTLGIYAEPSVRYNLHSRSTLPTYWQEHRTTFSIPVGLRITW